MIKLKQKQEITIAAFLEGKSQRQIAKDTGVDRKTIRKYLEAKKSLIKSDENKALEDERELIDDIPKHPNMIAQTGKNIK